jgi:hypothetical protein
MHVQLEQFSVEMMKSQASLNQTFAMDAVTAKQSSQVTQLS